MPRKRTRTETDTTPETERRAEIEKAARRILAAPYTHILIPEEEGGFSAQILEFPGCFAQGDTAAETFSNLESAAAAWVEAILKSGKAVPPPRRHYDASGSFLWRPPRYLHARAMVEAELEGVSLNQYVTAAVSERVGETATARTRNGNTGAQIAALAVSVQARIGGTSGELRQMNVPTGPVGFVFRGDPQSDAQEFKIADGAARVQ